jgi:hypothetical protein
VLNAISPISSIQFQALFSTLGPGWDYAQPVLLQIIRLHFYFADVASPRRLKNCGVATMTINKPITKSLYDINQLKKDSNE